MAWVRPKPWTCTSHCFFRVAQPTFLRLWHTIGFQPEKFAICVWVFSIRPLRGHAFATDGGWIHRADDDEDEAYTPDGRNGDSALTSLGLAGRSLRGDLRRALRLAHSDSGCLWLNNYTGSAVHSDSNSVHANVD